LEVWPPSQNPVISDYVTLVLALAYSKDFRATFRANALSCWPTILHGDLLRILDFFLGAAFHAVCLHSYTSFAVNHKPIKREMSILEILNLSEYENKTRFFGLASVVFLFIDTCLIYS